MPIIENTYGRELYELHKAVKALDRALDIRGRQEGAIYLQSYHLIQDATRLYEENDKLRELSGALVSRLRVAEQQLEMEGSLLDMRLVGDLRELGVEVDDVR